MKKFKFFLFTLGLLFTFPLLTSAQTSSEKKIQPFTLIEAKLPQVAPIVVKWGDGFCSYGFEKKISFKLVNFEKNDEGIKLDLVVTNKSKNPVNLVSKTNKNLNRVYLVSNNGNIFQASNINEVITLDPLSSRKINLEFDDADTENYFFVYFNIIPEEYLVYFGCEPSYFVGPFYLEGTKYLLPNRSMAFKLSKTISPENFPNLFNLTISSLRTGKKSFFYLDIGAFLKNSKHEVDLFFYGTKTNLAGREIKKYPDPKFAFSSYLIDNDGNVYFIFSDKYSNSFQIGNGPYDKKSSSARFLILPNFINGATEFTLVLNNDPDSEEDKNEEALFSEEKSSYSASPQIEIEEAFTLPEQITKYYSQE